MKNNLLDDDFKTLFPKTKFRLSLAFFLLNVYLHAEHNAWSLYKKFLSVFLILCNTTIWGFVFHWNPVLMAFATIFSGILFLILFIIYFIGFDDIDDINMKQKHISFFISCLNASTVQFINKYWNCDRGLKSFSRNEVVTYQHLLQLYVKNQEEYKKMVNKKEEICEMDYLINEVSKKAIVLEKKSLFNKTRFSFKKAAPKSLL